MIAASVYLERWRGDCWPDARWCACDIERIRAIQADALKGVLALLAVRCHNAPAESQAALYAACAQVQDLVNSWDNYEKIFEKTESLWITNDPPASVAGRMEMSHGDFQRACQVAIRDFQDAAAQAYLIHLLCEAVRCSRECVELSRQTADLAVQLGKRKSQPI